MKKKKQNLGIEQNKTNNHFWKTKRKTKLQHFRAINS